MYLGAQKYLDAHGKNTKAYDYKYIRIGYQRGAAIDNWRRIIATIIEKDSFCIELNNTNNKEIKGFLKWLEHEIGAEIEELTGTKIEYL